MRDISNDTELKNIFEAQLKQVIDSISERILNVLLDYVMKDIYDKDVPYEYPRTYEFFDSWINTVEKNDKTGEVIAEVFSDINKMKYRKVPYITPQGKSSYAWAHGSPGFGDLRAEMSSIIEEGVKYLYPKIRSDGTWNPAAKKRRFFQDTIRELDKRGQIWKWFEEEMRSRGIAVEKGGSINLTPSGGY